MFVQSTDNRRNGQNHEMGNLVSTSITVTSSGRRIRGWPNVRNMKRSNNLPLTTAQSFSEILFPLLFGEDD